MNKLNSFAVLCLIFVSVECSFGQENTRPPEWVQRVNDERARQSAEIQKINKEQSPPVGEMTGEERVAVTKKATAENEERTRRLAEINQKLAAPIEYRNKHAEFLKAKNTGLARLFPDKNCGEGLIVDVKELERCANTAEIKGGGSLYSIRLKEMPNNLPLELILSYVGLSDIHFVGDKLIVGNEHTQDIICNIGEVELAEINAKSEALKFLTDFKPGKTITQVKSQNEKLKKGVGINNYNYSTLATVKLNNTYVLRSIAYKRFFDSQTFWTTDQLVVFKIVGQEADGSIIILWRKLKEKNAPFLKEK